MQDADPTCNVYLRLIPVEEGKYCVLQTIRHPNLSIPAPVDTGIHPHMISFVHLGIRLGAEPIRILHGLRCAAAVRAGLLALHSHDMHLFVGHTEQWPVGGKAPILVAT